MPNVYRMFPKLNKCAESHEKFGLTEQLWSNLALAKIITNFHDLSWVSMILCLNFHIVMQFRLFHIRFTYYG